ncbi:uncharacterized protein RHOBADRAFT_54365, partial [Rhodotorula graminis WP1]
EGHPATRHAHYRHRPLHRQQSAQVQAPHLDPDLARQPAACPPSTAHLGPAIRRPSCSTGLPRSSRRPAPPAPHPSSDPVRRTQRWGTSTTTRRVPRAARRRSSQEEDCRRAQRVGVVSRTPLADPPVPLARPRRLCPRRPVRRRLLLPRNARGEGRPRRDRARRIARARRAAGCRERGSGGGRRRDEGARRSRDGGRQAGLSAHLCNSSKVLR